MNKNNNNHNFDKNKNNMNNNFNKIKNIECTINNLKKNINIPFKEDINDNEISQMNYNYQELTIFLNTIKQMDNEKFNELLKKMTLADSINPNKNIFSKISKEEFNKFQYSSKMKIELLNKELLKLKLNLNE